MDTQTKIDLPLLRFEGDRYAEELAFFELKKKNKDLHPMFFCFLPKKRKYFSFILTNESLLKSFGFEIIHSQNDC